MTHLHTYENRSQYRDWKTRTVELEGCQYTMKYCPETEEIIVQQPTKTLVGYRKTIGNHFPEIINYDGVGLEPEIAQMLIMERPKGRHYIDGSGDDVRMPRCMTAVKEVELSGNKFILSYNWDTDLIVIHIPEIEVSARRSTIEFGIHELKVLHGGRLMEDIQMFMFECAEDDLGFNPEDVF